MLNKLKSIRNNEDGFTLIELLIVIVIIGILAAIAIPIFLNQQKAAVDATVKSDVRNTVSNVALYLVTHSGDAASTYATTNSTGTTVGPVLLVATGTNVVSVAPEGGTDAAAYKVSGSAAAGNFISTAPFVFTSSTGQYK